jgi:hypothetical protein
MAAAVVEMGAAVVEMGVVILCQLPCQEILGFKRAKRINRG